MFNSCKVLLSALFCPLWKKTGFLLSPVNLPSSISIIFAYCCDSVISFLSKLSKNRELHFPKKVRLLLQPLSQ